MFEKAKLRSAVMEGDLEAARAVLAKKREIINQFLGDHGRALALALAGGNRAMIELLHDNGAHVPLRGNRGKNMLFDAVYHGQLGVLAAWAPRYSTLLHDTSWGGDTLLHIAAEQGHADIVAWLLEDMKFDSEKQDDYGRSALYYAEKYKHEKVIALLKPLQKQALQKYQDRAARLMAADAGSVVWKKLDADRIAQVRDDQVIGYRITEIFNFAAQERTRLYRNLETNAETVESRGFAELGDAAVAGIRQAAAEMRAAGGMVDDAAIVLAPPVRHLIGKKG